MRRPDPSAVDAALASRRSIRGLARSPRTKSKGGAPKELDRRSSRWEASFQRSLSCPRRAALALGALAGAKREARAADYPTRPVRVIVPYTPGGFTDLSTRLVAEPLSRALGQPVVVENRPGANSIVGAGAAASSPSDGYTMLMVLPAHAANATLQAGKMPFDPDASFAPISLVATSPLVLASGKRVPARTLREFLDYAKARPGEISYGSSGLGSTAHLAMETLQIRTGLRMVHVPYRGT
jgi:tripartite-type tricarboxylate transporter receptor subunit TctC